MIKNNLPQASLLFLLQENQILLAMKKRGFGVGHWNGVGGKPNPGESIEQTTARECEEEIQVIPKKIQHVADLNFFFSDKPEWNQQVVVYTATEWEGEPKETEEMKPQWFDLHKIPYDSMWVDDKHWLPKVLAGEKVKGEFILTLDQTLLDFSLTAM
jgi:ADP-ribose pyrophosphatase YjhB (NUDIX family)